VVQLGVTAPGFELRQITTFLPLFIASTREKLSAECKVLVASEILDLIIKLPKVGLAILITIPNIKITIINSTKLTPYWFFGKTDRITLPPS
jgi:hypothetical protein